MKQIIQAIACALIAILVAPAANALVYDQAEEAVLAECRALNLDLERGQQFDVILIGDKIKLPSGKTHAVISGDEFNAVCFGDLATVGEKAAFQTSEAQSASIQSNQEVREVGQEVPVVSAYDGVTWFSPRRDAPSPDKYEFDDLPQVDSSVVLLVAAANSGRWAPVRFKAPSRLESIQENVTVRLKSGFKPTSENIFYLVGILILTVLTFSPFFGILYTQRRPRARGRHTRSFVEVTYNLPGGGIGLKSRERSRSVESDIRFTDSLAVSVSNGDMIDLLELFNSSERSVLESSETEGGFEIVTLKR